MTTKWRFYYKPTEREIYIVSISACWVVAGWYYIRESDLRRMKSLTTRTILLSQVDCMEVTDNASR